MFSITPAEAADWLGTVSADWFTTGNWNPAAIPGSGTAVNINNAATPNPATINAPGAVSGTVTLGSTAGQSGTLNVTSGGLATTGTIYVGLLGSGTLNISGGSIVSATGLGSVADSANSSGTITVSGAGTQFNPGQLYVAADVNTLGQVTIQNGASITTGQTVLGYFSSTANGTLTVTNATASLGSMTIGERGTGTFNLNGGSTGTSGSVSIGTNASGNGTANIAGAGTTWSTGTTNIGTSGAGALNISSGAKVTTTSSFTIVPTVSLGGSATVTGAGSQWDIVGNSAGSSQGVVGLGSKANSTSTLTVSDGGKVTIKDGATTTNGQFMQLRMGISANSTGSLTVTGTNSSFTTPYDVYVAYNSGTTGNITVSSGGALNTGYTVLGASGTGNALVTGAGSVWTITDMPNVPGSQPQGLAIGSASTSNGTLTIADGGSVNVNSTGGSVVLGGAAGSQGTLNIGAAAASPAAAAGTLNATSVVFATGATGTINFNHTSNNYVFAPGIQGTGPGTVNFVAGKTILSGNNTYTGTTNISAGATAQFGNGGTTGLISGNVTNNGAMIVNLSSSATYAGVISGSGTFEKAGSNTLSLTGANTFTGGTTISSGTLNIGAGGTTGSTTGNIVNNSILAFNRSNSFTFSNLISGTGSVDKMGAGTVTLAAANTYTGGTSVSQGTLRLGASNRLASTGSLFIFGGATFDLGGFSQTVGAFSGPGTAAIGTGSLTFGNNLDRTFQGFITGSGSFIKQGTGSFTMTANNAAYTGTTTVNDGLLAVNGNLSNSATIVNANGTLGGTGTVGQTTVNGTIAPGNSIGTLNVNGPYVQNAGSFYNVEVNAAGQSDLINVTGTATINGGTVRVVAGMGAYDPTTIYTILTSSGARTGTFTGVTSNFAFLDPTLTYDPNNVYLTLVRNSIDFASVGITPNQISAGGGLAALGMANPIVAAALMLTPDQARAAFDSLSGEIHPSLHSLMLDESALVRDAILGRQRLDSAQGWTGTFATGFADEDEAALAYAKKTRRMKGGPKWPVKAPPPVIAPIYGAWVQGYGNWTHLNSDGNAATLRATTGGAIGGVDVTLNHNWRFGVAAGGGRSDARVDARASSGTIDTFHIAAYGGGRISDIAFRTGASYSHHDISTTRTIAFPGFADTATASYGASTSQVFGEAAYNVVKSWVNAEAFANLAYVSVRSDRFTETGGPAALTVAQTTTSATYSTLGVRAQAPIPAIGPWAMTARGSLGWQHAYDGATPVSLMAFATSPTPFAIAGVPIARDALLVEAGLDAMVYRNTLLALLYTGRIASGANAHALKANLAVRF
ncbi:autotransporter outer membrane beta-barrel domain-containing protein [Afipia clevelandensis]|uniref:Outer membrane autotransporter barrel domain-containing protein n=1 Tax=Afipia clevelandensis ATCC 49720 TaxID=883079 RepID=K8P803_9BRAD|nr:autotransporter domain-containing protein [Afipia clevelandensis]EKS37646.1 outer membrane autotransporter barrel domain-containing protein [Afipia clevelandensis ATCC 49720]